MSAVLINGERLRRDVIVVGASAGGLEASVRLLASIPMDIDAILALVIHRSPHYASMLLDVLQQKTGRRFVEPALGSDVEARPGAVYLGPRDMHLLVTESGFTATRSPKQHFTRPAVDTLFLSAAATYGKRVAGVLLSGTGDDGVIGLVQIKTGGGLSLVQDPDEAEHESMPANALAGDSVDAALEVADLGSVLTAMADGRCMDVPDPHVSMSARGWPPRGRQS